MTERLHHANAEMLGYFATHRRGYGDLYPSEQAAFAAAAGPNADFGRVLDAGCAMGGLCRALHERYRLTDYTGVEIHAGLARAAAAQRFPTPARILGGDVQELDLPEEAFDTVFSLSCVDWNLEPRRGRPAGTHLAPGPGALPRRPRRELPIHPLRSEPARRYQPPGDRPLRGVQRDRGVVPPLRLLPPARRHLRPRLLGPTRRHGAHALRQARFRRPRRVQDPGIFRASPASRGIARRSPRGPVAGMRRSLCPELLQRFGEGLRRPLAQCLNNHAPQPRAQGRTRVRVWGLSGMPH